MILASPVRLLLLSSVRNIVTSVLILNPFRLNITDISKVILFSIILISKLRTQRVDMSFREIGVILSVQFVFLLNPVLSWPKGCSVTVDNVCYEVFTDKCIYSEAEKSCALRGGRLAMMSNVNISEALAPQMKKSVDCNSVDTDSNRFWIGLNDRIQEGKFMYSDGSVLTAANFTSWATRQPNTIGSYFGDSDCVSMSAFSKQWFVEECAKCKRNFICEYVAKSCNVKDLNIPNASFDHCHEDYMIPYHSVFPVSCEDGFILEGSPNVTCYFDGTWSIPPRCELGCSPPIELPNAIMLTNEKSYFIGDNVTYVCKEEFYLDEYPSKTHFTITCGSEGIWIPVPARCLPIQDYQMKRVELHKGQAVALSCLAERNVEETEEDIMWYWMKDSKEIAKMFDDYEVSSNGTLVFKNFTEFHEGIYVCFAVGEGIIPGIFSYDLKLTINVCDLESVKPIHYVIQEGTSALLTCPHSSSFSVIGWYKDNVRVFDTAQLSIFPDGTLFLHNIGTGREGVYTCKALERETSCLKLQSIALTVIASAKSQCGNIDRADDHPWTVSLWWKGEIAPFCYGALIHESWVVTAGHCLSSVYRKKRLNILVKLGNAQVESKKTPHENTAPPLVDFPVSAIRIHPKFSKKSYTNNLALLKLKYPVHFSHYIQPICLPESDITQGHKCGTPILQTVVSGWGPLEMSQANSSGSSQEIMTLIPFSKCQGMDISYSETMLCGVASNSTKATYIGDSGSPLATEWKGRIHLLGVYSWGERSLRIGEYDYFSKITAYTQWIRSIIDTL